ncbi:MAG: hypothetical protein WCF36_01520 [Candidatus Nanopelagicales bacterium]
MIDTLDRLLIAVVLPLIAVWVIVVVDIVRQPRMTGRAKLLWLVVCTVIWPMLIVYWLTRPVQGRLERSEDRTDPHSRLVDAALGHESGRLDDLTWTHTARALRGR